MLYHHLYCYSTLPCFTAKVTLLLRLNDEFDSIWTSCCLLRRFRRGYGDFGFYDHSDIMTKMVWSQKGHITRLSTVYLRLLPGRKNYVCMCKSINGEKHDVQKCLLLGELYQAFKNQHPAIKISSAKF